MKNKMLHCCNALLQEKTITLRHIELAASILIAAIYLIFSYLIFK
jgi:hypothetical protein